MAGWRFLKFQEERDNLCHSIPENRAGRHMEYFVFSNWGQLILEEMLTERRGNMRRWGNLSRWQGRNSWLLGNLEKKFITGFFFFKYFQEGVNCNEHKFLIDVVSMILWLTYFIKPPCPTRRWRVRRGEERGGVRHVISKKQTILFRD